MFGDLWQITPTFFIIILVHLLFQAAGSLFINHVVFELTHNKLLTFMSFLSIVLGIELLYMLKSELQQHDIQETSMGSSHRPGVGLQSPHYFRLIIMLNYYSLPRRLIHWFSIINKHHSFGLFNTCTSVRVARCIN